MNNQTRTKKSFRFSSLLALTVFINQFIFISFAGAMSDVPVFNPMEETAYLHTNDLRSAAGIEAYLHSRPEFEQVETFDLQYQTADYIDNSVIADYHTIADFKQSLQGTVTGGDKQYIPIAVGDITTFITRYPLLEQKMVGDEYINTRLVVSQIEALLGRNLINSPKQPRYKTEQEQYNSLLNNAMSMAASMHTLRYGTPANGSPSVDMIWPELREINGEAVIVPIVHLTAATITEYSVKGNTIEFNEGALVESADFNDIEVSLGRDAFIEAISDLTLKNSSVNSTGSMSLISGGTLSLLSSQLITKEGDVKIAGQSIHAETILHRYDLGNETGTRYGAINSIVADGDVVLRSYSDLNLFGVTIDAGAGIILGAGGSIKIAGLPVQSDYSDREGRWQVERSEVSYLASKLSAEETIQIIASGRVEISGAEIVSDSGHIEIMGAMGISILDETAQYQSQQKGKFGKKKVEESVYQTVAIRSVLDAGKGIKLSSDFGDITLRSVDFSSQQGTKIKATSGGVNLLMSSETDHYSYSSVKEDMFNTVTRQKGHNNVTGVPNAIVGGLAVEAFNGVVVEFVGDPNLSVNAQLDELSNIPALSYLSELRDRDDVDFEAVLNVDDSWKKSQKTLSPAAIAVITIAVAVAAGPAAGGIATTVGGAAGVAASAAFTSLVTTASISLANGNSIEKTLASLSSDENLRSLAVTMVTAGAIAQIDATFFTADSVNIDAAIASNGSQAAVDAAMAANTTQSLGNQILQATVNSSVRAGVRTLAYGGSIGEFGDSFQADLLQTGIDHLGQEMATEIGVSFKKGDMSNAIRYMAHAATGCIIGAAKARVDDSAESNQGNCVAGAGGAVVGEFIADIHKSSHEQAEDIEVLEEWMAERGLISESDFNALTDAEKLALAIKVQNTGMSAQEFSDFRRMGINAAKLGAAISAFAAEVDVQIAANSAENAAENNALPYLVYLGYVWVAANVTLTVVDVYDKVQGVADLHEKLQNAKDDNERRQIILAFAEEAATDLAIDIGVGITGTKVLKVIIDRARENGAMSGEVLEELEELNASYSDGSNGNSYKPDVNGTRPEGLESTGEIHYSEDGRKISIPNEFTYVDGVSFKTNLKDHISKFDGINKTKVSGTHNADEFYALENTHNIKIGEKVEIAPGITRVEYSVPAYHPQNQTEITHYKTPEYKTVYDPNIYSDELILEYGQKAASLKFDESLRKFNESGRSSYFEESSYQGINFEFIIRRDKNGVSYVENVYPI